MATAVVTSSETRSITLTLIVAVQSSSMLALTIADANSTADSCHVDKIEETTARSPQKRELLARCFTVCQTAVSNIDFRHQVLRLLVKIHNALLEAEVDYISACRCLRILGDGPAISQNILKLLVGPIEQKLLAYQVALDLVESDNQAMLLSVEE